MFSQGGQFSIRWQRAKGFNDDFTIAHEMQYFDILISALHPESITFDLIKVVNPLLQPNFDVFVGLLVVRTVLDLLSHDSILNLFLRGQLKGVFSHTPLGH